MKRKKMKREYLAFKVLVCKGERKGKKNPHALVQILFSLYFLPIWEERKMLALWRTLHFPFPRSISLQTNKGFFFSFLPQQSLAFAPASLQPNTYILNIFLPIVFINHCIEYGVVQELSKPFFFFQRDGNRIHDEENEGCLCSSSVLFCIFFFSAKKKKKCQL